MHTAHELTQINIRRNPHVTDSLTQVVCTLISQINSIQSNFFLMIGTTHRISLFTRSCIPARAIFTNASELPSDRSRINKSYHEDMGAGDEVRWAHGSRKFKQRLWFEYHGNIAFQGAVLTLKGWISWSFPRTQSQFPLFAHLLAFGTRTIVIRTLWYLDFQSLHHHWHHYHCPSDPCWGHTCNFVNITANQNRHTVVRTAMYQGLDWFANTLGIRTLQCPVPVTILRNCLNVPSFH